MRSFIVLFLFTCLSIGVASAQALSGPVEGILFDAPTQSLRAVHGFPGSATFGPALVSDVDFGSVAPHKNYAIAFTDGRCLFVSGLDSGHVSTTTLAGVFASPEGVAWSSDSSVAILYSRSGNWIQTLVDLPKSPRANSPRSLAALGGSLLAVVSDATGKQIAIAMQGTKGGVYLTTSNQEFIPLAEMANPIALAFSEDALSLYALDGAAPKLEIITISDWNSRVHWLVGLRDPVAIRAGHDAANQPVVLVASGRDRQVGVYSLASRKFLNTVHLSFQPTGLQDLGLNSFVIGPRSKPADPLWLFSPAPRAAAYFVPAISAGSKGAE
jgi:hypothetical protein